LKNSLIFCLILAVIWSIIAILQLWFSFLSIDIFIKISITIAILVVIVLIISISIKEYSAEKEMKKKGFID
jgi:magnesium-transporting ATPase (P-type)